jgi:hypothetical protein
MSVPQERDQFFGEPAYPEPQPAAVVLPESWKAPLRKFSEKVSKLDKTLPGAEWFDSAIDFIELGLVAHGNSTSINSKIGIAIFFIGTTHIGSSVSILVLG